MRLAFIALLISALFALVNHAAANPLRPALLGDDGYNESWVFTAEGDGFYAQVIFAVANLGPGSGRATCRVLVLPGAKAWKHQLVASPGDWSHAASPEPRLALPGCELRGGTSTTLTVEVDEGRAVFTLPAISAGDERLRIEGAKGEPAHRESLLIDEAAGSAVIMGKRIGISASLLHTLSRVAPDEIAKQWIRVRARDADEGFSALVLVGGPATEAYVFDRGRPPAHFATAAKRPAPLGKSPMLLADGVTSPTLRPKAELVRYEPLREMGFIGRVLGAIVGDPLVTVHEGLWSAGGAERRVLLETITFR